MKPSADRICDRRRFLRQAAAAGVAAAAAPYVITSTALGAGDVPAASERIAVGFIGVGGHGIAPEPANVSAASPTPCPWPSATSTNARSPRR